MKYLDKIKKFLLEYFSLCESRVGLIILYFLMYKLFKHFLGFETAVIFGIAVILANLHLLLPKKL